MRTLFSLALLLVIGLMPGIVRADEITDPDRKKLMLDALKAWYYNLSKAGFAGFTCDVSASIVEQLNDTLAADLAPGSPIMKLIRSMKTKLSLDRRGDFTVTSGKLAFSGNAMADSGAAQAIAGVERSLNGVMGVWRPFVFGAYFSGPASGYRIFQEPNAYTIVSEKDEVTIKLSGTFVITEVTVGSEEGTQVVMRPTFKLTDNGYLVEHMDLSYSGMMDISLGFVYRAVRGVQVPVSIDEKVVLRRDDGAPAEGADGNLAMVITLSNHAMKKK